MEEIKTLDDLIKETMNTIFFVGEKIKNGKSTDKTFIVMTKVLAIFLEARDLLREGGYYAELKKIDSDSEKNQQGKLSYSFTWLTKLKSAANDEEREKILQDWLDELAHKKSAEND